MYARSWDCNVTFTCDLAETYEALIGKGKTSADALRCLLGEWSEMEDGDLDWLYNELIKSNALTVKETEDV